MTSTNWQDWSLEDLKQLVQDTRPALLADSAGHFQQTVSHLSAVQDTFMAHMNSLGNAWQGKAATAAISNAQTTYETMDSARSLSASADQQTTSYQAGLADHQKQAEAVPNVDTSWGHAASSGGWAGTIGIGVAKYEQQQKYDKNRDQVVQIVRQMDAGGNEQAAAMNANGWPSSPTTLMTPPPYPLPPVPGASKPHGPTSPTNPNGGSANPGRNSGGPGYTPVGVGTSSDPHDGSVVHGSTGHHPPGGTSTTTPSGTQTPGDPTVTQGTGGGPGEPGGGVGGSPIANPAVPGVPGGAGAAAAVLGGAGLAGAAGGRGLLGGAGARGGGTAGDPGGRLSAKGGALGESDGDSSLRGGARSGLGADDGALRAGVRGGLGSGGVPADDELGAGRGSALRGPTTGGFGGEPVAAEAGRPGGYPMGGGGGRRRSEDEEAPMPDYLVETDDIWGDGASAAPPVIGE